MSRLAAAAILLCFAAACREPGGASGGPPPARAPGHATPVALGAEIVDAVDGSRCAKGPSVEAAVYEGRTFYFCTAAHRRLFVAAPERYAARAPLRTR